ncbi:MAG: 50S ribosomal protein L6 [Maricaulaceae bacterium]
MSRTGKKPIDVPGGVTVTVKDRSVSVKGSKGELGLDLVDEVDVSVDGAVVSVIPREESKRARAMWGMQRSLIANMIEGVSKGFEKNLELVGVGYRAQMQGTKLKLSLGFSHDVLVEPPEGVKIEAPKPTEIKLSGADKQAIGQAAADIRKYRPPEPYKGKGIKYAGEQIRRKEGKKK